MVVDKHIAALKLVCDNDFRELGLQFLVDRRALVELHLFQYRADFAKRIGELMGVCCVFALGDFAFLASNGGHCHIAFKKVSEGIAW
jgi:hypothetical protein